MSCRWSYSEQKTLPALFSSSVRSLSADNHLAVPVLKARCVPCADFSLQRVGSEPGCVSDWRGKLAYMETHLFWRGNSIRWVIRLQQLAQEQLFATGVAVRARNSGVTPHGVHTAVSCQLNVIIPLKTFWIYFCLGSQANIKRAIFS